MRFSMFLKSAVLVRIAYLVAFVALLFGCSYENTQVGDIEIVYLIDDDLTPYYVMMFESKWSKSTSFVASASSGSISWTSPCMKVDKGLKSYNCTKPLVIPFHDSEVRELNIDVSYNNDKFRKKAKIRNPYYFFLTEEMLAKNAKRTPEPNSETESEIKNSPENESEAELKGESEAEAAGENQQLVVAADSSADIKDTPTDKSSHEAETEMGIETEAEAVALPSEDDAAQLQQERETGSELAVEPSSGPDAGGSETDAKLKTESESDSGADAAMQVVDAKEPDQTSNALEPSSNGSKALSGKTKTDAARNDVIWDNRTEIANQIRGRGAVFHATASKLSGGRISIVLNDYSPANEVYYGLQKNDGEVSNSAKISGKNTRANITSTFRNLILLEKVSGLPSDNDLYLIKTIPFEQQ